MRAGASLEVMFTRARWFLYGAVTTVGATAYVVAKVRKMRERMTPETVARATALSVADVMAFTGRRLAGKANRPSSDT